MCVEIEFIQDSEKNDTTKGDTWEIIFMLEILNWIERRLSLWKKKMTQGSIKESSRKNDFIIVNWKDNQQEKILNGEVNLKKGVLFMRSQDD